MKKLKMHTPDGTQDNIARIAELFPNCVTETKDDKGTVTRAIDFDQLRQELSDHVVEGPRERFHIDWPGKREALLVANSPVAKTLRPCRQDSVEFDTTTHLFIEGDNLDALKLLQETYLNKIKLIYIDPPYNTGSDFIYDDDFAESADEYLRRSNQVDDVGRHLIANREANGRFHSDWMTMMYSRLKLARTLLRDDGVFFVSIDDIELGNLRRLCDEVFGEGNFEGHIHWRRRHNQPNDPTKMLGLVAEHILAYSRDKARFKASGVGKVPLTGNFSNPDNDSRGDWASKPWKAGSDQGGSRYQIVTPLGEVLEEDWLGEKATFDRLLADGRIIFPNGGRGSPRKKYFKSERESEGQCATNWWPSDQFGSNQEGNSVLADLMGGIKNTFSNPKPPRLLHALLAIANCRPGDIVMDFFAGSGTMFHAAFQYEHPLRVIGVQLPEVLDESIAEHGPAIAFCQQFGLPQVLSEVTKERIRRVGKQLKSEAGLHGDSLDIGFRVLKVDTSNMKDVYYQPDAVKQETLHGLVDNVKEDRTDEDLLFQVLLDWGVDLTLPIASEKIRGKAVHFVDTNALAACFEPGIDEAFIKELAARKPLRAVFRDTGYGSDATKINVEQIFKLLSPGTEVKSI